MCVACALLCDVVCVAAVFCCMFAFIVFCVCCLRVAMMLGGVSLL